GVQKIADEIVPSAANHVGLVAEAVIAVGQQEKVEVLVGFDQLVDDEHGIHGRYVAVHGAVGEQELTLQVFGLKLVGLVVVIGAAAGFGFQQALPLFGPIVFVDAIVVVAGFRDPHLEEIGVAEHRAGGGESAARMAVDTGAIDVDPGVALGEL